MADLLEDLINRRDRLNNEAERFRRNRDRLNDETKMWSRKRDENNSKVKESIKKAEDRRQKTSLPLPSILLACNFGVGC